MEKTEQLWRVWLDTGRYVHATGVDEEAVRRSLTRTQRRRTVKVVPVAKREEATR